MLMITSGLWTIWSKKKLAESIAPEIAQALKEKPLTPLSGDIRDLAEATPTRIARDFDCVGLDYNAFYPGGLRLRSATVVDCDEWWIERRSLSGVEGHQQNTAAYYTPYTFSGKERDLETNLSYFGARYYEAGLSLWLSVDPMSEARPYLSPYNYCQLNPVMLVDPTGMLDDKPGDLVGEAKSKGGGSENLLNRLLSQMPTPGPKGLPATMRPSSAQFHNNPMIAGNGGGDPLNPPTREKGGFIKDKDTFYKFMNEQAKTNPVEVAAWELINPEGGENIFYVQPWQNNTSDESYNNPAPGFENHGSSYVRQIHTHPGSNRPGYTDASRSSQWGVPVRTIGADGKSWEVSYPKHYAVPRGMLYGKEILIN